MLKFFLALSLICFFWLFDSNAESVNHQVVMKSISYEPKNLKIKVGESVEWVNQSLTEHSASSDDLKTFETGLIEPQKKSKPIQIKSAGTYQYHCSVHGKTMHATIVAE